MERLKTMKNDDELKTLINLKKLEELQRDARFDTRLLLDLIDSIDALCANWFGPEGYREQIERLAEIADEVINDENFSSLEDEENRIYDLAAEITDELFEPLKDLESLYRTLSTLEELFPDDEEDFDEMNEDENEELEDKDE